MKYYNNFYEEWVEYDTMLQRLEDQRILSIKPYNTISVIIEENCDSVFSDTLDREDLLLLISELQQIADSLEE